MARLRPHSRPPFRRPESRYGLHLQRTRHRPATDRSTRRFVTMKRVLTSLILIPIVLYVVLRGPVWLVFSVVTLCAMLCYREYCGIAAGYGITRLGPVGFAAGLGVLALPYAGPVFLTAGSVFS